MLLIQMTGILIRRQPCEDRDTQGGGHVMLKAEPGVRQLQAKECQRLPATHQRLGGDQEGFSPTAFRGSMALPTP